MKFLTAALLEWLKDLRSSEVRWLLLCVFVVDASFGLLFMVAIQSYLDVQRLAGLAVPGLTLALFAAGKLSTQYISTSLTDRAGSRVGLLVGLGALAISLAGFLLATRAAIVLIAASFVYGTGSATIWPALLAEARQIGFEGRSRLTGAMTASSGLGLASVLGLGFFLPSNFPFWPIALFDLIAVMGLMVLLFATRNLWQNVQTRGSKPERGAPSHLSPTIVRVGLVYLLQAAAISALLSIFRPLGENILHISLRWQIVVFMPGFALFGVGVLIAGLLGQSLSRGAILGLASGLSGMALAGIAASGSTEVGLALLYLGALALGLTLPTTTAAALDASGGDSAAPFGIFLTFEGVGHIVGPAVGAVLVDARLVLAFAAMLMFAGCIVALALRASLHVAWHPAVEVGNAS